MRYLKLKNELKKLAKEIRYWKSRRKQDKRDNMALWQIELEKKKRSYEFRHKHIAHCQLRGRLREQIERPASNNLPNEDYIKEIMDKHEEALRASTQGSV